MTSPPGFENIERTPISGATRGTKAWADFLRVLTVKAPAQLRRSQQARARMSRIRR